MDERLGLDPSPPRDSARLPVTCRVVSLPWLMSLRSWIRGGGVRLKRVIGLPGDTVRHRNGTVYVNGRRSSDDENTARARLSQIVRVPPHGYFVMSDNARGSCDSRYAGTIAKADVIGKVILVYSPPWGIHLP